MKPKAILALAALTAAVPMGGRADAGGTPPRTTGGTSVGPWRQAGIFLLHSTCAVLLVLALSAPLAALWETAAVHAPTGVSVYPLAKLKPAPPETFLYRLTHDPFDAPFLGEILIGMLLGYAINSRLKSRSARWAWLPALAWWLILFSPGDDQVGHFIATEPLAGAVAYSLGAWLALRKRDRASREDPRGSGRDSREPTGPAPQNRGSITG